MPIVIPLPVLAALVALGVVKYETVVKIISRSKEAAIATSNAINDPPSVQFQLDQLTKEATRDGILSEEKISMVLELAKKEMEPAALIDYVDKVMKIIYDSLGPVGKKVAEQVIARTANKLQALFLTLDLPADRQLLGGPHPNTTYAISTGDLFFGARTPADRNYTDISAAFVDSIVNPNSPFKSPDKYSSVFSPETHAAFDQIAGNVTKAVGTVWRTFTNTAELLEWFTGGGWKWAVGIVTACYFFRVYMGRRSAKDDSQLNASNTEMQKAILKMTQEVQTSNAKTQQALIEALQKSFSKSPRVGVKPPEVSDDEEVKRPSRVDVEPPEVSDDEKQMISLFVDAFVTLAVSRALLFEIPQDPPQSIWSYVKSFVVNVTEPGFLTRMVCMEPEDADKLNPISRSFWSHYSKDWSKEEQRRYTPLLKLKDLHVSAALKVKTVLDNSDNHDPKSLLGYIAKYRNQIKSEGLYQTLARFPLLLLEYFGDNLKTLESDIRDRDRAIQREDPITEKLGIDSKVWGDPTIDLLFLLDDSWMDAGRIGYLLDMRTPMTREQLYWLSKHPRVLQDHLFRNRLKHGIQSRVEVKTRNATIVVFKPWIENGSIWDIMENKVDNITKNKKHTIAHLRAAFLIAAADLENQIMEEHFEWKDGPFKRMAQPIHEARWRGNAKGTPMIMPRSTMQAPWFTEVTWFSSLATCIKERDMVQMMLKNPKNFPMFSDMKDGKEGDKVHALLNKKHVTITFAKNLVALQVHDMMKSMGQYSFAREHGLDCFVCGQFRINGFAALVHYGQSKALHNYKEYATDAALSRVILSMGEAHRYGYALNLKQASLRIDPGTNRVFVELWGISKTGYANPDFQKLLTLWTTIKPESQLATTLKTRDNVLESVKGCQLSSPYEKREGLMKMGPWLQALKQMHKEGFYGFITPKLLQSQRYYENKTPQDNGIPTNIDHRGLIDDKKWSMTQDCHMLLKSMMLLPKYIEFGTWDEHLPIWQDDIPMRGLADAELTIEMLIDSRMQSLLFQDDLFYLRSYTEALPVRESLFSYSFNGKKKWIYDIEEQKLYQEIDKKLVDGIPIAAIRVKK